MSQLAAQPSASMEPEERREKRQKVALATKALREMIIKDELPPGSPIRERTLAERLGVSRTPMRGR